MTHLTTIQVAIFKHIVSYIGSVHMQELYAFSRPVDIIFEDEPLTEEVYTQ